MKRVVFLQFLIIILAKSAVSGQVADASSYLDSVKLEMMKQWPNNRTVNLVYHGHSVPSGYFTRGAVNTFSAYPYLSMREIKENYPYTVLNTITTSIGGEQSEQGATRFSSEVLVMRPDVIFIDYALNDRGIGLERAKKAWISMIEKTIEAGIPLILMTPTPDLKVDILKEDNILEQHAQQIRSLAHQYNVGLIDSYQVFKTMATSGKKLNVYMAQNNHPNAFGHAIVANEITKWFINE